VNDINVVIPDVCLNCRTALWFKLCGITCNLF